MAMTRDNIDMNLGDAVSSIEAAVNMLRPHVPGDRLNPIIGQMNDISSRLAMMTSDIDTLLDEYAVK